MKSTVHSFRLPKNQCGVIYRYKYNKIHVVEKTVDTSTIILREKTMALLTLMKVFFAGSEIVKIQKIKRAFAISFSLVPDTCRLLI